MGNTSAGRVARPCGRHVGELRGREIFGLNGRYLGEISDSRLITDPEKSARTYLAFLAKMRVLPPRITLSDIEPADIPSGFMDFPAPDEL